MQFGSAVNQLYAMMTSGQPAPAVGMGATILRWTDRQAAEVVMVFRIGVNPAVKVNYPGGVATYRFRKNRWEEVAMGTNGRWKLAGCSGLLLGIKEQYDDPSF